MEVKLIHTWNELRECVSDTCVLKIDIDGHSGFIKDKESNKNLHYLSTHTFYGSNYRYSTKLLQKCGFNVELVNWNE